MLTSPLIAAIPSDNPEREMSKLHSAYAWGVVVVVLVSTVFLKIAGRKNWFFLSLFWCVLPLITYWLFSKAEFPQLDLHGDNTDKRKHKSLLPVLLCTACIFFGGAAECTMNQWVSGFAEKALNINKVYGDIFGMALFAFTLGLGRTLYSKKGKKIYPVLLIGMGLSALCYMSAAFSTKSVIGLIACVLTGLFTSMLWPGTIIYINEKIPDCGVGVYALLAAGGDLGASLSPQLLGIIADLVSKNDTAIKFALSSGISVEEIGMKAGMFAAALFPLLGFILLIFMDKYFKKHTSL